MKVTIIHGSPRNGNTGTAERFFTDELVHCGDVEFTDVFPLKALPAFCIGCQRCLGGESCPHAQHVEPVLEAVLAADALVITSPHYGASTMPASLKNLFDHLDFLALAVSPREEMFGKRAFIITTGSGSKAAIGTIAGCLKNWGINCVHSFGMRMLTNAWDKMPKQKQARFENSLRRAARRFYAEKRGKPYLYTVFMYYLSRFILRRYVGSGSYPYNYWDERGWFQKRPF
ncbi:MAG: NAD(P)H-dependent oxidoreductase [Oscillospiraceae bacterium]|jgi:multimeric flavodoxin WrbA|nr:NAD(P)H-dependent oxidoreductase [Oscillospiraceae bacterium]